MPLRLTTRDVTALPVTGKEAVYWDRDLAGFGVRVQANGRKVYVVQSRGPAGLRRVALGPCTGESIDNRRREAAAIIDRIKRGENPTMPEPERDFAVRCLRTYVNVHCKPKTAKLYRTAIDRNIVPALGTTALHQRLGNTPPWPTTSSGCCRRYFAGRDLVPQGRNSLQGGAPLPRAVLRTPPMPERLLKLLLA